MDNSSQQNKTRSEDDSSINEEVNDRSDSFSVHSEEWVADQDNIATRVKSTILGLYDGYILPNVGMSLLVFSQFLNSLMVLACKLLVNIKVDEKRIHPLEILFFRQSITWICCVAYLSFRRGPDGFFGPKKVRKLLILRGVVGFGGVFGIYYALQYLSLSDATAIVYLVPMTTAILAFVILRERYSVLEAVCAVVSLGGVLLIAKPKFLFGSFTDKEISHNSDVESSSTSKRVMAVVVDLIGVAFSSSVYIILRRIGKQVHPIMTVNYLSLCCSIISTLAILILPGMTFLVPRTLYQWFLFTLIGISGFFMQVTLTAGVQRVPAGRSSLTSYLSMVFAIFWDLLIWQHLPNLLSLLGISIIVFNAVLVVKLRPKVSSEDEEQVVDSDNNKYVPLDSNSISLDDLVEPREVR